MKNILITGISTGIGKEIAKKFVKKGWFVLGTYNKHKKLAENLANKLKNIKIFHVNFTKRSKTKKFINLIKNYKLEAIVNNAGIFEEEKFSNFDLKIWDKIIECNLTTPLIICTQLQNSVVDGGKIVNIASGDGTLKGSFSSISYYASKSALINVTKSLANNLGPRNIRVNSISPGWINTGMSTESSYEAAKLSSLGRNGKPEEVADLAYYLCSKKSSFITGQNIIIDGGYINTDLIMKEESKKYNDKK